MAQALSDVRSARPSNPNRVPPHSIEAEQSLLGAMLLSRDAIVAAVEARLTAADFYKPAHGHIFDAVTGLYGQGEPADPVTVSEALRRAGVLETIGGGAVLVSLQAGTPAIGNASRYARIVEEYSLLRRLITVAGEIAEIGYRPPGDVGQSVDLAEALVFEVAQRRVTDSMLPIRQLLERHLDHIEALYERGQDITGVPTGYLDLDQQLAGLQPSNLIIVGGRPGMGKALSLDTPIATPTGWTTMGDLAVDDEVFDEQGRPCRVTYATPVMLNRSCYEVAFDDGSTVIADADHQWFAYDFPAWRSYRAAHHRMSLPPRNPAFSRDQSAVRLHPRVVTTQQMVDEGVTVAGAQRPNWYIPLSKPLDPPEIDLPVDPYVLGCWLGDGTSTSSGMTIGEADGRHLHDEFVGAAATKHIPSVYLRASSKQRLALLQGLLDTDGHITAAGNVDLCLANRPLLAQARELVCSLGHKPGPIRERSTRLAGGRRSKAWRFGWVPLDPVFRLPWKAERYEAARSRGVAGRIARRAIIGVRPVPSVPVRCISVDSPSHLYLATRSMIPTHNTSFALGLATHAALDANQPVLVFSLEMSHLELTQRLLCSEARVDATRLRNGKLLETDWPKISHAVGRLAEAPMQIDDNPHLTVMEIRAKARRLKSREGLGLIVIDYLQLMTGRPDSENRQVEVSEISRGLKILARELDVPVVALSQLSRNLENRADKRPVLADLRESGCLTADTRVLRADTGAEVTMGELFVRGEQDIPVWSLGEDLKLTRGTMKRVFCTGVKPVFELCLASGRTVKASANHPFLRLEGWARVDELKAGDRIAVPRRVPEPSDVTPWPEAEIVMLAHLIGDGCFASRQPLHYTSADPANLEVVEAAAAHFGVTPRRVAQRTWAHVYLPSPYRLTHGRRNPICAWLHTFGLNGLRSYQKFVPREVFSLPREQVAHFLHHLWATDGSIGVSPRQVRIYYASTSHRLARDVQMLLLRLGILSRIKTARKPGYRLGYHVLIYGAANQVRFLDTIGCHGARGEPVPAISSHLRSVTGNTNLDTVPVKVWSRVKERMLAQGVTARAFASGMGTAYCGSTLYKHAPSRPRLGAVATLLDDPDLHQLASSDVFWDSVSALKAIGEEPVYDATVENTHNFIADGVVAHNSLEQDADVVIFLYRDELYSRDSPDRGTAEVIVAKHRNGPTGITQLAFLEQYTRFANMARGV